MRIKKEFWQFIRFCIVGVLNTLVDVGVFTLLIYITTLDKSAANTISYCVAVVNSYILNKVWTFGEKGPVQAGQAVRFILVNAVSLGVSILALNLAVMAQFDLASLVKNLGILPMDTDFAKLNLSLIKFIIVTPLVLAVNFAGSRLFVFRQK